MTHHLPMVTETIAIVIVDDDAIAREGLTVLLKRQPGFTVVAALPDVAALASVEAEVDIILIDARQVMAREAMLPMLADAAARARLIATRVTPDNLHLADLVRSGVFAFALKDVPFADLVTTIHSVAGGARVMPPCVYELLAQGLVQERHRVASRRSRFRQMTAREREIAVLIASGKSNKEIAALRCISPHTAKSHVRNIMEKLSVHTRLEIAARAHIEDWPLNTATPHGGTAPHLKSVSAGR